MNHDEHLDRILDEALNEYRQAEPLSGLEDRVLQRLAAQPQKRGIPWLRWGIAAACAASLSLAIWMAMQWRPLHNGTAARQAAAHPAEAPRAPIAPRNTIAEVTPAAPRQKGVPAVTRPIRLTAAAPVGKNGILPEQFPSRVPLTDDERAFMVALDRRGEALRAVSPSDELVVITEIEIKPLSSTDKDSGENQ